MDTRENNARKNKEEIRPRIAMAGSWEIRHKEKPYSFLVVFLGPILASV